MHTYQPVRRRRFAHDLYELLAYRNKALTGRWVAFDENYLYTQRNRIRLLELWLVTHHRRHSRPGGSLCIAALAAITLSVAPTSPWTLISAISLSLISLLRALPATALVLKTTADETITYTVWGLCTELQAFAASCFDAVVIARRRRAGTIDYDSRDIY